MPYKYDESTIEDMSSKKQKEEMKKWFYSRYEDPVHSCPYDEGAYVYIYGGPYDAFEELSGEFSGLVPDEIIEELAEELSDECWEWSAKESEDWADRDYDIDYVNNFMLNKDPYPLFIESMDKNRDLLDLECSPTLQDTLYKMLFANIITVLETYLSETFVTNLFKAEDALKRFIAGNPDKNFKDKKYTLSEIMKDPEIVNNTVKVYLANIVWHRFETVMGFYKVAFKVDFPKDMAKFYKYIETRHDLVHRNGKTNDGEEINLSKEDVLELHKETLLLVENIETQINRNDDMDVF